MIPSATVYIVRMPAVVVLACCVFRPPCALADTTPWWRQPELQRGLRLSPAQIRALDGEYKRTLLERKRLRQQLDDADAKVNAALMAGDLPDAAMDALVAKAEVLRTRRNIARLTLLMGLYRVLTPTQRLKLESLAAAKRDVPVP